MSQIYPGISRCKGCHAEIRWATTQKGKKIPLDSYQVTAQKDGEVLVDGEGNVFAAVFGQTGYRAHFATCPAAEHFRQVKKETEKQEKMEFFRKTAIEDKRYGDD